VNPRPAIICLCLGLALSTFSAPPALAATGPVYTVAPGDTLNAIAARFGMDMDTLAAANGIDNPDRIVVGQQLTIPPQIVTYTVRPGDTLIGIATRFGLDVPTLLSWNQVSDPNLIVIGTELQVPGYPAASPAPAAAIPDASSIPPAIAQATDTTPAQVSSNRRSFPSVITAYSFQAPIGGARGSVTRSGTPVRWGVVAVDPQVIPLGTRLMIDGFDDVFVAEDTGGAIRGNHVEIFYPDVSAALRFGVQTRRVTILG
jgi:LysM repeat protein